MGQNSQDDRRVTIERLHTTYLVPKEHPNPDDLRARIDTALRQQLVSVCGSLLSQALDADDASVWLIRSLHTDLALEVGIMDDAQLAHLCGTRIATSIVRTIARGADGDAVLHFANRADYLAQFASDLAEGRAWGKWYYAAFDSLRSLPTGAALREALTREPEQTVTALFTLLATHRLEPVLYALGDGDVRKVYETCLAQSTARVARDGYRELIDALVSIWQFASVISTYDYASAHNALRLYLALRAQSPRLASDGRLGEAIRHFLGFAEIVQRLPARNRLIERLAANDLSSAIQLAREAGLTDHLESLPFFEKCAVGDDAWLERVVRGVSTETAKHTETRAATARAFTSPFGGIFLLLPAWLDSDLSDITGALPYADPEGMSRSQALRYILAVKCMGRPRVTEALLDPALILAAGLERPPSFEIMRRWSESATAEQNRECLQRIVGALAQRRRASSRYLSAELVTAPPLGRVLLLRDLEHDHWLYADCAYGDVREIQSSLTRGIELVRAAFEAPPEFLLAGSGLDPSLDPAAFGMRREQIAWTEPSEAHELQLAQTREGTPLVVWTSDPEAIADETRTVLARHLARPRAADEELTYFALSGFTPGVIANAHFDLTCALAAHTVLRTFASRLMGFQTSRAEYLYQNFLAGLSTVRGEAKQIRVDLAPSPLHLILRLAGVDGQTYSVPWLDGAQVTLSLNET